MAKWRWQVQHISTFLSDNQNVENYKEKLRFCFFFSSFSLVSSTHRKHFLLSLFSLILIHCSTLVFSFLWIACKYFVCSFSGFNPSAVAFAVVFLLFLFFFFFLFFAGLIAQFCCGECFFCCFSYLCQFPLSFWLCDISWTLIRRCLSITLSFPLFLHSFALSLSRSYT